MGTTRVLKILVIEERAEFREVFRSGLEGIGQSRLLFAPSLKVGVVALKKTPFDLLVLRDAIARQNSYALLKAIRSDGAFDKLAVIVVRPECTGDEAQEALDAGATSCLSSRFEPEAVREAVISALKAEGQSQPRMQSAPDAGKVPDPIDNEEDARRLLHSGLDLLGKRMFARAAQLFLSALKRRPIFPEAFAGLAECFSGLGDAVQSFRFRHRAISALAVEGRLAEANKAMHKLGDAPSAELADMGNPFHVAGLELRDAGKLDAATQALEAGIGHDEKSPALRKELAALYLHQGKEKKAVRTLHEGGMDVAMLEDIRKAVREAQAEAAGAGGAPSVVSAMAGGGMNPGDDLAAVLMQPEGTGPSAQRAQGPGLVQEPESGQWDEKRQFPRIPLADFSVSISRFDGMFTVVDISMGGICFKADAGMLEAGQVFRFNLVDTLGLRMKKVQAVVRFTGKDKVGCQFLELSERQQAGLEELIKQEKKKIDDAAGTTDQDAASGIERDAAGKIVIKVDW